MRKGHLIWVPKNCPFPWGDPGPHLIYGTLAHPSPHWKWHLCWFCHYSTADNVQHTDHRTFVTNNRVHLSLQLCIIRKRQLNAIAVCIQSRKVARSRRLHGWRQSWPRVQQPTRQRRWCCRSRRLRYTPWRAWTLCWHQWGRREDDVNFCTRSASTADRLHRTNCSYIDYM